MCERHQLFREDFSKPGLWPEEAAPNVREYRRGTYRIELRTPEFVLIERPLGCVSLVLAFQVDLRELAPGTAGEYYGVACGNEEAMYLGGIDVSSKTGNLWRLIGDNLDVLDERRARPTIRPGQVNRIRMVCTGDAVGLFVENAPVATAVRLEPMSFDRFALVVESPEGGTAVSFDDLIVTRG